MAYEIDFIGVAKDKAKKDADAISIRWNSLGGKQKVVVYDGGFEAHGIAMAENMDSYYFNNVHQKVIDAVIVSHSDMDHTAGLKIILQRFEVKALYMNRPWEHVDDLFLRVNDGRVTKESLQRRLKENYSFIAELEDIASQLKIPIYNVFEGTKIIDDLIVLSPSKEFYIDLLTESAKNSCLENVENKNGLGLLGTILAEAKGKIKGLIESWDVEQLRENEVTSSENETSVVVLGDMMDEKFLLVGDAGIRALNHALNYAENKLRVSVADKVNCLQIPHHGGKHNISPSILNRMVGGIVREVCKRGKEAIVSVAEGSDHPRQIVTNAYIRRGVTVVATHGKTICHRHNMSLRPGWSTAAVENFDKHVEDWD